MRIAGIDFSLNSTAITIFDNSLTDEQYVFYSLYRKLTKKRTDVMVSTNIELIKHPNVAVACDENEKILDAIETTNIIFNIIKGCDFVAMEGFAFNARGNRLAELSGYQYLLRAKLVEMKIPFTIYPPLSIKKFAGYGRYTKEEMIDIFIKLDNIKLAKQINELEFKYDKPIDDIVDSYFVCKKCLSDLEKGSLKDILKII
jgi:hypothetical protein